MGYYIETDFPTQKAMQLEHNHGATKFFGSYGEVPFGKVLICVVRNFLFDAAAIVYNKREYTEWVDPSDDRPKQWLLMDTDTVIKLQPRVKDFLARPDA